MTKNGNQVIVMDVDMSKIPNIIKGQVKVNDRVLEFEWEDNGTCVLARDNYGNVRKPEEDDMLVKKIV